MGGCCSSLPCRAFCRSPSGLLDFGGVSIRVGCGVCGSGASLAGVSVRSVGIGSGAGRGVDGSGVSSGVGSLADSAREAEDAGVGVRLSVDIGLGAGASIMVILVLIRCSKESTMLLHERSSSLICAISSRKCSSSGVPCRDVTMLSMSRVASLMRLLGIVQLSAAAVLGVGKL
jgi:hypothetical protein